MLRTIIAFLFALPFFVSAQNLQTMLYGGGGADQGYKMIESQAGGYLLVGSTSSFGLNHTQAYIVRLDSNLQQSWSATYGGLGLEKLVDVIEVSSGGYAAVGYTTSQWSGDYDGYLLRFDESGNLAYAWQYGGLDWDYFTGIAEGASGQFYISGNSQSYGDGSVDAWLMEYRENQSPKPFRVIVDADSNYQNYMDVYVQADGAVLVCGEDENGPNGGYDGLVVKYTDDLVEVDRLYAGTAQDDGFNAMNQFSDGSYILGGYEREPAGRRGGMGAKMASDLSAIDWTFNQFYAADVVFNDVVVGSGDTVAFAGTMIGTDGKHQVFITGYTFFNGFAFSSINGAPFKDNYGSSILTRGDGYVYVGSTNGFSAVYDDVLVQTLDENAAGDNSDATDLKDTAATITNVRTLKESDWKVYPTLIASGNSEIRSSKSLEGELILVDMTGRKLQLNYADKTIFLTSLPSGSYLLLNESKRTRIVVR